MPVSPGGGSGWPVRERGTGRPRAQRASDGRLTTVEVAKCPTVAIRAGRPRRAAVRPGPGAGPSSLPLDAQPDPPPGATARPPLTEHVRPRAADPLALGRAQRHVDADLAGLQAGHLD